MTSLRTGAYPDLVEVPSAPSEVRGTVVIVAGVDEGLAEFRFLIDQLVLAGFAVELFLDVTVDPGESRQGAVRALDQRDGAGERGPHLLLGSDAGAALAASLAVERRPGLVGLVLVSLVTSASRRLTTMASALPVGLRLPDPRLVQVPTLVFHGDSDEVTDVADAVSWATQLPFGSLRLVQHGDHRVVGGESRRTVAASIVLFAERQRAGEPILSDGFAT